MSAISYMKECIVEQMSDMTTERKLDFLTDIFILTEDLRHELAYGKEDADIDGRIDSEETTRDEYFDEATSKKSEGSIINSEYTGERGIEKPVIPDGGKDSGSSENRSPEIQADNLLG